VTQADLAWLNASFINGVQFAELVAESSVVTF
jgi:hypothetical protein